MVLGQVRIVSEIALLTILERLCQVEKKKQQKPIKQKNPTLQNQKTNKPMEKENVNPIFSKGKIASKELQAGPLHFSS